MSVWRSCRVMARWTRSTAAWASRRRCESGMGLGYCSCAGFSLGFVVVGDRGVGEVGGAEGGGPDAVEVVLGFAQVQRESLVEQAEPCQGVLESVDGAGSRREVLVRVISGRIVGGALGELSPLLAFTPPIQRVRPGQDEFVAALAVQRPGAGAAVDDGLEGAEARRAAAARRCAQQTPSPRGSADLHPRGVRSRKSSGIPRKSTNERKQGNPLGAPVRIKQKPRDDAAHGRERTSASALEPASSHSFRDVDSRCMRDQVPASFPLREGHPCRRWLACPP